MDSSNKTIAKNTIVMYVRMFVTMCLSLYTSRIVLRELGEVDFGLYNVVAGVIVMFGFLNGAMANTTSRYIAFYLGKKNDQALNNIFSMSLIIHACIAGIVVLLGETIGLWFLYEKMTIPEERLTAALWVYQFSIIATVANILYVPFNACVIAHEKLTAFASLSILDTLLRFGSAVTLIWVAQDKLIVYGGLILGIGIVDVICYYVYCRRNFKETNFRFFWNTDTFKEMFGFAGWSMLGNFSYLFFTQGLNIIINIFCSPAVNAARGIAVQVEGVVKQFASNIQTAINPQIIKSYSSNNMERMYTLIFTSSRFCFYLLLCLSLPLMLQADFILGLWLGEYPAHTTSFLRIILCNAILDTLINPLFTGNLASGKVRIYQIWVSVVAYSFMFITYFVMRYTLIPESVFLCTLTYSVVGIIVRIRLLNIQIALPIIPYLKQVIVRVAFVSCVATLPTIALNNLCDNAVAQFFVSSFVCVISVLVCVYALGITSEERKFINNKLISCTRHKRT